MNQLEDRLRAAVNAAADTVPDGSAPPLRLPTRTYRVPLPRWSGPAGAVLAPLAAATAVAVVVVAVVATRGDLPGPGSQAGGPSARALRVLPPYYVALTVAGPGNTSQMPRADATVVSTSTDRRIATIRPPKPFNTISAVTGSPDGRTFVLAAQQLTKPWQQYAPTALYQLRIKSGAARLTALPIAINRQWPTSIRHDLALSPDGSRLAVTEQWPAAGPYGYRSAVGLRIYDLATGTLTASWKVLPPPPPGKCCVFDPTAGQPSWEADGRYVAIEVSLAHCQDCVALVDTTASGSVQAAGKVIVRTRNRHYPVSWTNTIISPDGTRVLRSALVGPPASSRGGPEYSHVFEYSVSSGQILSDLRGSSRRVSWTIVWCNSGGNAFVVATDHYHGLPATYSVTAALYRDGRWISLELPTGTRDLAW
jgi:hypothetical protein